jgi:hypothetical protein
MSSSLLENHKSKRACPQCKAKKLFTNDNEKDAEKTTIYYHCLRCNYQFFEHPGQKKIRDSEEKKSGNSKDNPSFSWGVTIVLMLLATILLVQVIERNEEEQGSFEPISQILLRS